MAYCHNCGARLGEDALFCTKCGMKVAVASAAASAPTASDEIREAFRRVSVEMDKAFNVAAKEIQEAVQVARENIQKSIYKEPVTCPNCGEKNPTTAIFCSKCGKQLKFDQTGTSTNNK
jgi:uncharacterized membrane protein YvbJ